MYLTYNWYNSDSISSTYRKYFMIFTYYQSFKSGNDMTERQLYSIRFILSLMEQRTAFFCSSIIIRFPLRVRSKIIYWSTH